MTYSNSHELNKSRTINILKPKLVYIIFKDSVRTSNKTQHFTITKINWLKQIFFIWESTKPINTQYLVTDS
jgi:hypothetical protein